MQLAGLVSSLKNKIYLENAHYCKGKTKLACNRFIAEI